MITHEEARSRVARGATHLDVVRPGWFNRIDTGILALDSQYNCVMAQSFGAEYGTACRLAKVQYLSSDNETENVETEAQWLGLFVAHGATWRQLQDAWIEAIADRKLAQIAKPVEVLSVVLA